MSGLEEAFKAEEEKFAARGEEILWETELEKVRPFHITYRLNLLTYSTDVRTFGCNMSSKQYRGIIRKSLEDITFKKTELPKYRTCTSKVRKLSNENGAAAEMTLGPAPVNIVMATFLSAVKDGYDFKVTPDNRTLILEDIEQNEIARFRRKGVDH